MHEQDFDKKDEFLSRFKELLEKYDVSIIAHAETQITAYHSNNEMPFAEIGQILVRAGFTVITPETLS